VDITAEGFEGWSEFLSWRSDQRHNEQYTSSGLPNTLPTPREIRERCELIRAKWTATEHRLRRPDLCDRQPLAVDVVSTKYLPQWQPQDGW